MCVDILLLKCRGFQGSLTPKSPTDATGRSFCICTFTKGKGKYCATWANQLQSIDSTDSRFFPILFQNTALHLAATGGHPDVVTLLLSSDKQEILMNKKNQNVLDAAMEAEQKKVLLAIVSHKR